MKPIVLRFTVVFSVLVLLFCLFCGFLPSDEDRMIYENTIRLHVIAASDNEHDQSVKLAVRDAILSEMAVLLENTDSSGSAARLIGENLDRLRAVCDETLDALGERDRAVLILSAEEYPTRNYGTLRLPAGVYRSLRVQIGEAKGQNWWCVLYPALCQNVAKTEAALSQTGFSPEQIEILTNDKSPKYKLKFKFLEIFG